MKFIRNHIILVIIFIIILFVIIFNIYSDNVNHKKALSHDINDLYLSDDRIYNSILDDNDKKMYDFMLDKIMTHKHSAVIDFNQFGCSDYEQCGELISKVNSALYVDHPELMNYAGYRWRYYKGIFKLTFIYAYPFEFMNTIGYVKTKLVIAKMIRDTEGMSDEQKIRYVYKWMGENNKYDRVFTYTSDNQSIYNVFVNKVAVCAGFAKASQIIFSNIGIKSYVVQGSSTDRHMWNIVEYKGKYYYFDSTVAVSIKDKHNGYYDKGLSQEFMNSYTVDYPEWYPKVETTNMFQ